MVIKMTVWPLREQIFEWTKIHFYCFSFFISYTVSSLWILCEKVKQQFQIFRYFTINLFKNKLKTTRSRKRCSTRTLVWKMLEIGDYGTQCDDTERRRCVMERREPITFGDNLISSSLSLVHGTMATFGDLHNVLIGRLLDFVTFLRL